MNTILQIAKDIPNRLNASEKIYSIFLLFTFFTFGLSNVYGQGSEVYNDGGIRLKVWLHSVYTDANCSENFVNGPTKFVYNKVNVRASNGSGWRSPDFPSQNIINLFPQDMRFRLKTNRLFRFYKIENISELKMLNPFYPFKQSSFQNNSVPHLPQTFIAHGQSERNFNALGTYYNKVGLSEGNGYLLLDQRFTGDQAPDRYEWTIDEMFESDADMYSKEAGSLSLFNAGCTKTFGLPQYYEGAKNILPPYDALMFILMLDSLGLDGVAWGAVLGNCMDLFGMSIDPINFTEGDWKDYLLAGVGVFINDLDDAYAEKKSRAPNPAYFRGTPPGEVGYFATDKYYAKSPDVKNEGYMLVFAHQWEWIGDDSGYPEPGSSTVKNQAALCGGSSPSNSSYRDVDNIKLSVSLDAYISSAAHDGKDKGGFLLDALKAIGQAISLDPCGEIRLLGAIPEATFGKSERMIHAKAWIPGVEGEPGYQPTIRNDTEYPLWFNTNQSLFSNKSINTGNPNTFAYKFESWESDCYRNGGGVNPVTCDECYLNIGNPGNDCCSERLPSWLGGGCIWPPIPKSWRMTGVSDFDLHSGVITGTVNWRNSPPNTDNYIYVPVFKNSRYEDHIVRLKYKWTIPALVAPFIPDGNPDPLCPGDTYQIPLPTAYKNATFFQWQYIDVDGSVTSCPGNDANWVDIPNATCPESAPLVNSNSFTGTRYYRLKVFNRNGPGSKSTSGEKFEVKYSNCIKISILQDIKVEIDAPVACGTQAAPTTVRAGASMTLKPVLPPKVGSTNLPGIKYTWTVDNPNASITWSNPGKTATLKLPSAAGEVVRVIMETDVSDLCPTLTNQKDTCYFITQDAGCSDITGVLYVSHEVTGTGHIGSINDPMTLEEAAAFISPGSGIKHVKLLYGNYTVGGNNAIQLIDSLVFEGGYEISTDADGDVIWVKSSNRSTRIDSDIIEENPDKNDGRILHRILFRANGNNWTVQDINNARTMDAPSRDDYEAGSGRVGEGISNYVFHIHNSTGWTIQNVTARAGRAGNGSEGVQLEMPTDEDNSWIKNQGGFPTRVFGGNGPAGDRYGADGGSPGNPGNPGQNAGAGYGIGGNPGSPGLPGGEGRPGAQGQSGSQRTDADLETMKYFIPPGQSDSGRDGNGGAGGGGSSTNRGGQGGVGGKGGTGGWGGGTAFGIWLSGNSQGQTITNSSFNVQYPNNSPVGASGGQGTPGYLGEIGPGSGSNKGGDGGRGGTGGQGGYGAPIGVSCGSCPPNFNEYIQSGSSMPTPSGAAYPTGRVQSDYASGCTYSLITLRKPNTVTWGTLSDPGYDLMNYPDIAPGRSSTEENSDNPKYVYGTSLGVRNLITSAGDYPRQIYMRYYRPLPVITVDNKKICSGTPVNLSATHSMANPTDMEWTIQEIEEPSGITSATSGLIMQVKGQANLSNVMLPITPEYYDNPIQYQVRYREKDNCCGWSVPLYDTITVYPEIRNEISFIDNNNVVYDTFRVCADAMIDEIKVRPGSAIQNHPSGGSWQYEWIVRKDEDAFTTVSGANAATYKPNPLTEQGLYEYKRLVSSSTMLCKDSSNSVFVLVQNISNNVINFPVPEIAECGINNALPSRTSGNVHTSNINIGRMEGNVPDGPLKDNDYYYKWIFAPGESGTWNLNSANFYGEDGTAPVGYGELAQSWDPGMTPQPGGTVRNYGTSNVVFQGASGNGKIRFRRIAMLEEGKTACSDTSNSVFVEIPSAMIDWGLCVTSNTYNMEYCNNPVSAITAFDEFQGTCAIIAPDTVCPGQVISLELSTNQIGGTTLQFANEIVWYSVPGGPYNNTKEYTYGRNQIGSKCRSEECTHPLLNANCSNGKPGATSTEYVMSTPYDGGWQYYVDPETNLVDSTYSRIEIVIDNTTTYYTNGVGRCFTDTDFRNNPTGTGMPKNWQRKTVVTVTPFDEIKGFESSDNLICTGQEPDSIILTIASGSDLGNDGYFAIYDQNPGFTLDPGFAPIHKGVKLDTTLTGRQIKIPTPTNPTTYYARIENRCRVSIYDSVIVDFILPSTPPTSLTAPAACEISGSANVTITINGGTLRNGASWALYDGDPEDGATRLATTTGNSFTRTVTSPTTFYVRGESPSECDTTVAVSITAGLAIIEYAPNNTTTIAKERCTDAQGWTWYASDAEPDKFLFAIQKQPGASIPNANTANFTAEVEITVTANPETTNDVFYAEDIPCDANFVMPRYWNVHVTGGSTNGFIPIRFFFKPSEYNATKTRAGQWQATYVSQCPNLHVGPAQVFKTTDNTDFDPKSNGGLVGAGSDVQPTTINDYRYVAYLMSSLSPLPYEYATLELQNKNYVEVAWDGFSGGGIAIRVSADTAVLPVTLVKFTATPIGEQVLLDWETASEHNNDYFVVERSTNAKNWEDIGRVAGHGSTNVPHFYSLIDSLPYQGVNYYRLRQVDYDESINYSKIVQVEFGKNTTNSEGFISVVPNPTDGPILATIGSSIDQHINILILDISGRVMGNQEADLGVGINRIKLDLGKYPAGTYILSYTDKDGKEHIAKLVKQ